ncbi:uncharacterized protein LOC132904128 [Amyelois transitella]|uniref:uncharacterized protein LOC132904128 n=1 Tax=Amyelois transitella TaxID=680683 RepID=UPI00298F6B13|nr:uncharacterized protein LOC132904128 [Amyelois transitella]
MSAFEKTGIWPYNKLAFSDEDFAPVQVYQSNSNATININRQQQEDPSEENVIVEQSTPLNSPPSSSSLLLQSIDFDAPSSSAPGLITPEAVRPYPKVNKSQSTKAKKGKLPGKSRIYTDTPEKQRLLEIQKAKEMKKQEQERRNKAKEMKRALKMIVKTDKITKPKIQKKDAELETDSEDEINISLRESSSSPLSTEASDFEEATNKEEPENEYDLYDQMPRNYQRKTDRQKWSEEAMSRALEEVKKGMPYKTASKFSDIFGDVDFVAAETTDMEAAAQNEVPSTSESALNDAVDAQVDQTVAVPDPQQPESGVYDTNTTDTLLINDCRTPSPQILDSNRTPTSSPSLLSQEYTYIQNDPPVSLNSTKPQEIGTVTASKSLLDLPSTSFGVYSPRDLQPLPKIDRKRSKNVRKRKIDTTVLTSTPYKSYLEEETQKKKEKEEDYGNNRKAWMTSDIFVKWVRDWDRELNKKKKKILLLVDNCPAHPQQQEDPSEENVIVEQSTPLNSPPSSSSLLLQSIDFDAPSSSAPGLITPEAVRPYPKVNKSQSTKAKKGKLPGKSRIYTDTPEKQRLLEIQKAKEMKKQEQERRNKAKEMKRALKMIVKTDKITKPKIQKKDAELETDSEDEINISLRESSSSPLSTEASDFEEATNKEEPMPRNYQRKTDRQKWSEEAMSRALEEVKKGMPYKTASKFSDIFGDVDFVAAETTDMEAAAQNEVPSTSESALNDAVDAQVDQTVAVPDPQQPESGIAVEI